MFLIYKLVGTGVGNISVETSQYITSNVRMCSANTQFGISIDLQRVGYERSYPSVKLFPFSITLHRRDAGTGIQGVPYAGALCVLWLRG